MESLIAAAIAAPSGDNTQPWRFEMDCTSGRIAVYLDEARDPSPMNSGQRMTRIAIGSAIENILVTARRNGWQAELEPAPPEALARIKITAAGVTQLQIDPSVLNRVTNRRVYDGRQVSSELVEQLKDETSVRDGIRTEWIVDRGRITSLASLIGRSDARMFDEPAMLLAFLAKVRLDVPPGANVDEGLSLASIEAKARDRLALRLLNRLPAGLLRVTHLGRLLGQLGKKLAKSASGLCVIVAPDHNDVTDLWVGRALQRAWLALTARGLAAQPMMSGPVLENVLELGSPDLVAAMGREKLIAVREEFRALLPECQDGRLAALLRFGYAQDVSGRTGRLPLHVVTAKPVLERTEK